MKKHLVITSLLFWLQLVAVTGGVYGQKAQHAVWWDQEDEVFMPCDNLIAIKHNGKWGLIDTSGKNITPPTYDEVQEFEDWDDTEVGPLPRRKDHGKIRKGDKWGYINKQGKAVVPAIYDSVDYYIGDFVRVFQDGKCGFLDKDGNIILPTVYEDAYFYSYSKKHGQMLCDGKWGVFDNNGKVLIPEKYDDLLVYPICSDNLIGARVKRDGNWGFADFNGNEIIPVVYDEIGFFCNDRISIKRNGKWGFADTTGKVVIPLVYDATGYKFTFGKIRVSFKMNKNWYSYHIDINGQEIQED